jgi:hypothetical protein
MHSVRRTPLSLKPDEIYNIEMWLMLSALFGDKIDEHQQQDVTRVELLWSRKDPYFLFSSKQQEFALKSGGGSLFQDRKL